MILFIFCVINLDGYTVKQWNSYQEYTFGNVGVPDNGYLILGRDATRSEFENHWGNLGANVVYVNSRGSCPMINGGETYALYDSLGLRKDTVQHSFSGDNLSMQRNSTGTNTWTEFPDSLGNPGSGVSGGNNTGIVITEVTADNGDWHCEFLEIFYDTGEGGNNPPEIHNLESYYRCPPSGQNIPVKADISDDIGILADTIFYGINSEGFTNKIRSDSTEGISFFYTVNGYSEGDTVYYFVKAVDDSNLITFSDTSEIVFGDSLRYKVLFDCTKDETAGNADWVIDDDTLNPMPEPLFPWNGDDWLGAISDWGYDLLRDGNFTVRLLPPDSSITYGSGSPVDLSNFDLFIVPEPQNPFSPAEKSSIYDFIRNGGGLFMVADHHNSDRNGNGWDSPEIWNDFGASDSFGIHFNSGGDYPNFVTDSSWVYNPGDSVISGTFGNPSDFFGFWAGTGINLYRNSNNSVRGHIWLTWYSPGDSNGVMLSTANFGNGRVAGAGDSSPFDDGTANPGNSNIYDGWGAGSDSTIILNTTLWLCGNGNSGFTREEIVDEIQNIQVINTAKGFELIYEGDDEIEKILLFDRLGRNILSSRSKSIRLDKIKTGVYFLNLVVSEERISCKLTIIGGNGCLLSE